MEIKKNRKIIMAISVLVLAVSITSAQPMAINIGVSDTHGNPNTFVLVPLNITNVQNESIVGIVFDISFDPSSINLTRNHVQKGDLTSAWDSPSLNPANGRISIVFGGSGTEIPINGSGSVVVLNFSVTGAPGAKSALNISGIQISGLEGALGTASANNGTFTIEGQPAEKSISGTKFNDENVGISGMNQPNRTPAPSEGMKAMGQTPTAILKPAATLTPATIETPTPTSAVTTVSAKGTPAASGFGIVASMVGLFAWTLLIKRNNR
jgi:Cohesin domain